MTPTARLPLGAFALTVLSLASQARAQTGPVIRGEQVRTLELRYDVEDYSYRARRDPNRIRHLLVTASLGALNQATTGTLAGYGYDASTAPSAGLNARYLWPITGCSCGMGHGVDANFTFTNGPTFGAFHTAAWRNYLADLGYTYRIEFPCMRTSSRRIFMSGVLGVSYQYADAGVGDARPDNAGNLNVREAAARGYDHNALGWRLGATIEMFRDRAVYGFGVDLRSLHALDGDLARTFMLGARVSIGWDFWI